MALLWTSIPHESCWLSFRSPSLIIGSGSVTDDSAMLVFRTTLTLPAGCTILLFGEDPFLLRVNRSAFRFCSVTLNQLAPFQSQVCHGDRPQNMAFCSFRLRHLMFHLGCHHMDADFCTWLMPNSVQFLRLVMLAFASMVPTSSSILHHRSSSFAF